MLLANFLYIGTTLTINSSYFCHHLACSLLCCIDYMHAYVYFKRWLFVHCLASVKRFATPICPIIKLEWTLCMKYRKYDKRHVRSKLHSGCLETLCHVRGPLRKKMATLEVIPSRSNSDPSADPVPGQTMLPIVSLTESDIPGNF